MSGLDHAQSSLLGRPSFVLPPQQPPRRRSVKRLAWVPIYFRRLFKYSQMDFEYALWQMLYLCIAPRRVYRNIYYHKQTKNRWSRDDPAFVVLLALCLVISAIAYGVAYEGVYTIGPGGIFRLILYMICVDFLLTGIVIATGTWFLSNRYLGHNDVPHTLEQTVEWAYAFDVHCNAFFPTFLITHIIQFFFLPLLVREYWISALFANTFYMVAVIEYFYLTFLGFSALPFLHRTTVFLYPTVLFFIFYVIAVIIGWNMSNFMLYVYFGH